MNGYFYILDTLKTEIETIPLVSTVTQGSLADIDNYKQSVFPLVHIMVNNITPINNVVNFNITFFAVDNVDVSKDETTDKFLGNDNELDVLNTQYTIALRIYESLRRGDLFSNKVQLGSSVSIEPFTERFENYLAGMALTVDILIPNEMSIC
jgi:hypothetical protein